MVPQTIVLVDDDPDVHDSLRMLMLANRLVNPVTSLKGQRELQDYLARDDYEPPDVLIIDLRLQDGDGFSCIRMAADSPRTRERTALIAVSNHIRDADIRQAVFFGADAVVEKPLTAEVLLRTLAHINGFHVQIVRHPKMLRAPDSLTPYQQAQRAKETP
jgi:DNA-binding NarL/FixJ family response regulator